MSGQYDFLVIGDDEASLCAAAAAARAGASTAHLRINQRKKQSGAATTPAIPNFVWRRLELQDYDLTLEPASARVTLFKDGDPVITYAKPRETSAALEETGIDDHFVWSDFIEETNGLAANGYLASTLFNAGKDSGKGIAKMLTDPVALERTARLFGPSADLLNDYFTDERLKAHVSAHALGLAGASDREAGSAAALSEFFDEDSWRARTPKDATNLMTVLEIACQDAGVKSYAGKITEIANDGAKQIGVSIGAEDKIRTSYIFFATPEAAAAAGALQGDGRPGLNNTAHASITVRFKLSNRIEPPAGDDKAIFQIIDDLEDVRDARDAAVRGKLHERAPVEFEYTPNGEIVARTAYFPAAFFEDGAWRGWTGQDRQAAAAIIKNRIASRLPDFASQIRRAETEVMTPNTRESFFEGCDRVIVQWRRHNAISAAVKLIDEVMARSE
jgi:phytoene dehydrogenase-like protein